MSSSNQVLFDQDHKSPIKWVGPVELPNTPTQTISEREKFKTTIPEPGEYINLTEAISDYDFSLDDISDILHSWITRLSCEWCGEEPNTILLTDAGIQVYRKEHVTEAMKAQRMKKINLEDGPS